jgi:hypothetical protein
VSPPVIRHHSSDTDPRKAVAGIKAAMNGFHAEAILFFASPVYPAEQLSEAFNQAFDVPVFGCSTAGEIISPQGYLNDSLVAIGLSAENFTIQSCLLPSLSRLCDDSEQLRDLLAPLDTDSADFAFLLVDGLSGKEDHLVSQLQYLIDGVPVIGGSAGDGLQFHSTSITAGETVGQDMALLLLFKTTLDMKPFCIKHFTPTHQKCVITRADPDRRMVYEIDGCAAAEVYADKLGVRAADLNTRHFASHPLMLKLAGEYYVRSIQSANPDGSLTFYCAIDEGLILTLANPGNSLEHLSEFVSDLKETFASLDLVLGCDCILRRLELQNQQALHDAGALLSRIPFLGFSTYGEQFGSVHINHTLTGVALGNLL